MEQSPSIRSDTGRILELTREIEAARSEVQREQTCANRLRLSNAATEYKTYLAGLNGLATE